MKKAFLRVTLWVLCSPPSIKTIICLCGLLQSFIASFNESICKILVIFPDITFHYFTQYSTTTMTSIIRILAWWKRPHKSLWGLLLVLWSSNFVQYLWYKFQHGDDYQSYVMEVPHSSIDIVTQATDSYNNPWCGKVGLLSLMCG